MKQKYYRKNAWAVCTIMLKQAFNATQKDNESDVKIYGSNTSEHFLNWWLGKDYVSSQSIISAKSGKGVIGYTVRFDIPVSLIVCIVLCYLRIILMAGSTCGIYAHIFSKRNSGRLQKQHHLKRGLS